MFRRAALVVLATAAVAAPLVAVPANAVGPESQNAGASDSPAASNLGSRWPADLSTAMDRDYLEVGNSTNADLVVRITAKYVSGVSEKVQEYDVLLRPGSDVREWGFRYHPDKDETSCNMSVQADIYARVGDTGMLKGEHQGSLAVWRKSPKSQPQLTATEHGKRKTFSLAQYQVLNGAAIGQAAAMNGHLTRKKDEFESDNCAQDSECYWHFTNRYEITDLLMTRGTDFTLTNNAQQGTEVQLAPADGRSLPVNSSAGTSTKVHLERVGYTREYTLRAWYTPDQLSASPVRMSVTYPAAGGPPTVKLDGKAAGVNEPCTSTSGGCTVILKQCGVDEHGMPSYSLVVT